MNGRTRVWSGLPGRSWEADGERVVPEDYTPTPTRWRNLNDEQRAERKALYRENAEKKKMRATSTDQTPEDDCQLLPYCSETPCSRRGKVYLPNTKIAVCVGHYVAIVAFMSEEVA